MDMQVSKDNHSDKKATFAVPGSDVIQKEFRFKMMGKWLFYGAIVGVLTGIAGIIFQTLLDLVGSYVFHSIMGVDPGHAGGDKVQFEFHVRSMVWWAILLVPTIGGLLSGILVFSLLPDAKGRGTDAADAAIEAYHKKRGIIKPILPIVKMFATILTLGSGGSGGREGPIAQIGAGIGSFVADRFGLSTATRRRLLAAGIGSGIACMFRVPLAGGIFAAEVLYSGPDIESEIILPAIVASIISYTVYAIRFGWGHMFTGATHFTFNSPLELIPYFILAVIVSATALIFVKTFYSIGSFFERLKIPNMVKPAIGGFATGAIALALIYITGDVHHGASVLGPGYGLIQDIFTPGNFPKLTISILLLVAIGKLLATSLTIGSAGSAGVFGPSMVMGGAIGYATGIVLHRLMPGIPIQPEAYAIVGMAGFFSAAANTPLSTILFVSEIVGSYELMLPTMWVAVISYWIGKDWSIYENQVDSRLHSPAHFGEFVREFFVKTRVKDVIKQTRKFVSIPADATLDEIFKLTEHTRQRLFPVVDRRGKLEGYFRIDDLTHALHHHKPNVVRARDLIQKHKKLIKVRYSATIEQAYELMKTDHAQEILVVSDKNPDKVVGILTSADIMLAYTRKFAHKKLQKSRAKEQNEF